MPRPHQHPAPRHTPGPLLNWLCAIALLLPAGHRLAAADDATTPVEPLNIVILVSDDQRWDALGAAGNPVIHTPRLDQLATEGVRFEHARVTTSICMTSRASILTGQWMSRHGITRFGVQIEPDAWQDTYPAVLRDAGYWSGFVGKYGVGQARERDFDFVRDYQGRHWYEDKDGNPIHITERNAQDALEFLRERPKDQPFHLSVSFFAPHAEDRAPEQYLPQPWSAEFYEDVTIPVPAEADESYLRALPEFIQADANEGRVRWRWRFDTPERYQEYMTNYFRLITEIDEAVGRIVDELAHQGVLEQTLIVYIGDNGYFHGERGLADKWYPYEESIRVPLIVRDPRLPATARGMVRDEFVLNTDLAPHAIAAAGLPVPGSIQGMDFAPLYLATAAGEPAPEWRHEFFYEHPTITSAQRIPTSHAVVRRDWKYVEWPEHDYRQLFHLETDPTEKNNLAGHPDHAEIEAELAQRLEEMRQEMR